MQNRILKFRAWDRELNQWWYSNEIEAEFLGEILQGKYPEMVIQQYTGLLDRRGKEIYEGDIVKTDTHDLFYTSDGYPAGHIDIIGIVVYENAKFIIDSLQYDDTDEFSQQNDADLSVYYLTSEVIGNVWEHPELLK